MTRSVDECRRLLRAVLASQPLGIVEESIPGIIEQAAIQMASGQAEQSPAPGYRLVPIRASQSTKSKPRRTRTGSASQRIPPSAENNFGLIVPGVAAATRRELEVHFSERRPPDVKVTIGKRAAAAIEDYARRHGGLETGGILAGPASSFRGIAIHEAGGPGANAHHGHDYFGTDHVHNLAFLADLKQQLGDVYRQRGDWHVQPGNNTRPSGADLQHFAGMLEILDAEVGSWVGSYVGVILSPRRDGFTASAWVTNSGDPNAREPWYKTQPAELVVEGLSWSIA